MAKIFISYSWQPDSNKEKVIRLADRLEKDGIEVIIDVKDLKLGNDIYKFMERTVADPSIDKVLIICNSIYAAKADQRTGGVGSESMIITPEVYRNADQTKFIPIVFQKDKNDKPCLPMYLQSRAYCDLSKSDQTEYNKLLNAIFDRTVMLPELKVKKNKVSD